MIFVLLIIVVVYMIYEYQHNAKYILHPAMIVLAMYSITLAISGANYYRWGDVGFFTFLVIILFLGFFEFGSYIADRHIVKPKIRSKYINSNSEMNFCINYYKTIAVLIFFLIITYFDFVDIRAIAGGNTNSLLEMISAARYKIYTKEASVTHSALLQQCLYICKVLAYIYVLSIVRHLINRQRFYIAEILIALLYGIQTLLTTGRTELIYYIYGILMISYLLWMNNREWERKNDLIFLKQIITSLTILCILFVTISNIRNNYSQSVFDVISEYTGESIQALNQYILHNGIFQISNYWGEETQSLYYSILKYMGKGNLTIHEILPPVYLGNEKNITNVYTAIRRYIHDYGIFGTMIISYFMGYLYSYQFKEIRFEMSNEFRILIYSFLSYPLIELSIEERVFTNLLSARTVYCLLYFAIFYILLFTKRIKKNMNRG